MNKYGYFRNSEVDRNVDFDRKQLTDAAPPDIEVMLRHYYSLEFAVGQVLADGDERYYPNASFSALRFIAQLRLIHQMCGGGLRFLDVGCGLGSKVWIAQSLGFDAFGLEINPQYATIACELVGAARIHYQDALTFPDYSQFDVVYFYNPMPSYELETAILTSAKKDAIIYHAIKLQSPPKRKHVRLSPDVMRLVGPGPAQPESRSVASPPR